MVEKREAEEVYGENKKVKVCDLEDKDFNLNSTYSNSDFLNKVETSWSSGQEIESTSDFPAALICEPFKCLQLKNFIEPETFLTELRRELLQLDLIEKNNDLYQFRQTEGLTNSDLPAVRHLKELLSTRLLSLLRHVTGISLNGHLDLGCSQYKYTDTLLCHDDELEGRRVAFVLYLTPDWRTEEGGLFQLFSTDGSGRPASVARSVLPEYNSLVLFEVSPVSFHQVSEVLSRDRTRLSLNGWFHGPAIARAPLTVPPPAAHPPGHIAERLLYEWINPLYLAGQTQRSVRRRFERQSEIQLANFLQPAVYQRLHAALAGHSTWRRQGPADRQHVQLAVLPADRADEDATTTNTVADATTATASADATTTAPAETTTNATADATSTTASTADATNPTDEATTVADADADVIAQCVQLFGSEAMLLIMSQLTGLQLHPLAASDSATASGSSCSSSDDDSDQEESDAACRPGTSSGRRAGTATASGSPAAAKLLPDSSDGAEDQSRHLPVGSCPAATPPTAAAAGGGVGRCECEMRRWQPGCYTLANDLCSRQMALESRFFIGSGRWRDKWGGVTSYIVRDEEEELLSISPQWNTLCLVYRDATTLSFTKYVNQGCRRRPPHYEVFSTYYEPGHNTC